MPEEGRDAFRFFFVDECMDAIREAIPPGA